MSGGTVLCCFGWPQNSSWQPVSASWWVPGALFSPLLEGEGLVPVPQPLRFGVRGFETGRTMLVLFWLCPALPRTCCRCSEGVLGPQEKMAHSPFLSQTLLFQPGDLLEAPGLFESTWQSPAPAQGCRGALTMLERSCGLAAEPRIISSPTKSPSSCPRVGQGTPCLGLSFPGSPRAGRAGSRSRASTLQTLPSPHLVPSSTARASPLPNPNHISDGTALMRSGIWEESPNPVAEPCQAGCPGQREALGEAQSTELCPELPRG